MEVLYKLEYKPCLHFPPLEESEGTALAEQKAKEVSHFEMLFCFYWCYHVLMFV